MLVSAEVAVAEAVPQGVEGTVEVEVTVEVGEKEPGKAVVEDSNGGGEGGLCFRVCLLLEPSDILPLGLPPRLPLGTPQRVWRAPLW